MFDVALVMRIVYFAPEHAPSPPSQSFCSRVDSIVPAAKFAIVSSDMGFLQREAWGFSQREQTYSVRWRYSVTLSISASSLVLPTKPFRLQKSCFSQGSCDPHCEFVVSYAGNYEVHTIHAFQTRMRALTR